MVNLDTLMGLLIALRAGGVRLEADADGLRVGCPTGALTDALRAAIHRHRADLLALPRPHLSRTGELIIPSQAPPQYHWQPMTETLRELNAPSDEDGGQVP